MIFIKHIYDSSLEDVTMLKVSVTDENVSGSCLKCKSVVASFGI